MPEPAEPDVRAALAGLAGQGLDWGRFVPGIGGVDSSAARRSAVLMLFGSAAGGPAQGPVRPADADVLLLRRADGLRHHPGQIGFPGGGMEPGDADAAATAMREAVEETGVDPAGVETFAPLPALPIVFSNNLVTTIPAWWAQPSPVRAVTPAETAAVFRVPVSHLLDPGNRASVTHVRGQVIPPLPAFEVDGRLIWGFTAIILSAVFDTLGWTVPWDGSRLVEPGD